MILTKEPLWFLKDNIENDVLGSVEMMPLTMARAGESNSIKKIGGKTEMRQHLENLGFVPGVPVMVISEISGNVIVNVKESRIAISREMASKIMV